MTLAAELERYISGLTISQGRHAGQRFTLLPWERRAISRGLCAWGDGRCP